MKAERGSGKKLPLCKGAEGTGETDCHTSDIGHWFAMTGIFTRGAVGRDDVGIVPHGELQGVWYKAGRAGASARCIVFSV